MKSADAQLKGAHKSARPSRSARKGTSRVKPIWEIFEEMNKELPEDVMRKLPRDGAAQHDHYIHGSPKRRPADDGR